MTNPSGMQVAAGEPQARRVGRVLSATRYRHPGDVIRLIAAALVLAVAGAGAALVLLVAGLRRRRFRVIATVAGGFAAAAVLMAAIMYLTGQGPLGTLTA